MDFEKLLKELMEREQITQVMLADNIGMPKETLNRKIKFGLIFDHNELAKICDVLNIDNREREMLYSAFNERKNINLQHEGRKERNYFEKMFNYQSFTYSSDKSVLFNYLNETPLYLISNIVEIKHTNEEIVLTQTCFFPFPVDYCIKTKLQDDHFRVGLRFDVIPEDSIVGICVLECKNLLQLEKSLLEIKSKANTLFYIRFEFEFFIAYVDFNFEKKEANIYRYGRGSIPYCYPLKDVEIFGYVKGYYKCQF